MVFTVINIIGIVYCIYSALYLVLSFRCRAFSLKYTDYYSFSKKVLVGECVVFILSVMGYYFLDSPLIVFIYTGLFMSMKYYFYKVLEIPEECIGCKEMIGDYTVRLSEAVRDGKVKHSREVKYRNIYNVLDKISSVVISYLWVSILITACSVFYIIFKMI